LNSPTRPSRLPGLGLAAVVVALVIFAVSAALVMNRTVERATKTATLSAAYERARFAVSQAESLEQRYRLEPATQVRAQHTEAVSGVLAAMRDAARVGDTHDADLVRRVRAEHTTYVAAIRRLFAAVDRGDQASVSRIEMTEVDPSFQKLQSLVGTATIQHRETAAVALRDSAALTRLYFWLRPAAFVVGFSLLAILWRAQRRNRRRYEGEVLEQLRRTLEQRERAEGALAETQEHLRHAQRLESVGQLAGGVAHDFNNLLQVILGYCGLLEPTLPASQREQVASIAAAADRGADLTRQLLAFGGRQLLSPEVWNLNAIVADIESMLGRILPSQIDFQTFPADGDLNARVDRGQLEQVLVNLILNARDAMADGGTLTVFTETLELEQPLVVEDVELATGSYVRIAVRDTGCGMSEETKARAFEPFFTTKRRGEGTGLGLATVYGIVRQSGGFVSLESTEGLGTEVAICLPQTHETSAGSPTTDAASRNRARIDRVLLVEDETDVRSVLSTYLRKRGYDVLEATDGLDALETFRRHGEQIGVVVTDILMPRLDGWGLVSELRSSGENVPVIVMSGFTGETQRPDDERLELLRKPFAAAEVVRAIARVTWQHAPIDR
jgi:signal transduction histidine kinase/ActR/RegA family two-component response regulator